MSSMDPARLNAGVTPPKPAAPPPPQAAQGERDGANPAAKALGWLKDKAGDVWEDVTSTASGLGKTSLLGLPFGATGGEFQTRQVVHDPRDANDLLTTNGQAPEGGAGAEVEVARTELAMNAVAEERALLDLPLAARQAYGRVAGAVADQPAARRALQAMLLDGRLTGGAQAKDGSTMLESLAAMAGQDVVAPIDRNTLLAEVLIEAHEPVRVSQHGKNTCGATSAQILLLRSNPAEYVRIVSDLAKEAGTTGLMGGKTLRREANWNTTDDGGRTMASRLFQGSVMELAGITVAGKDVSNYDPDRDQHQIGPVAHPGLLGGGLADAMSQLTGSRYENHTFFPWNRGESWNAVKQALEDGRGPVSASLTWGNSGHYVQVDRIADGVVAYTNPWGQRETMSEAEFQAHVMQTQTRQA